MRKYKDWFRKKLNGIGFDFYRMNAANSDSVQLKKIINSRGINFVVDVGANVGQFSESLRAFGYLGKILSFEPITGAHEELTKRSRADCNWLVYPPVAIGEKTESNGCVVNISNNLASSSVATMTSIHLEQKEDSHTVGVQQSDIIRLDDVDPYYLPKLSDVCHLKVDTQGYEIQVLAGAKRFLGQCRTVQLEVSLVELYEGQALFDEICEIMKANCFRLIAVQRGFTDLGTGDALQLEVFFERI